AVIKYFGISLSKSRPFVSFVPLCPSAEFLPYPDPALLAHELLHVVRAAGAATGGAARLPAAERVDAGPRAGRRAGAAIGVGDAGLDAVEELFDLALVLGEDAGGEPVLRAVGEIDRFVERQHVADDGDRDEQFLAEQRMAGRQAVDDRRRDEIAVRELALGEPAAAREDLAAVGFRL